MIVLSVAKKVDLRDSYFNYIIIIFTVPPDYTSATVTEAGD